MNRTFRHLAGILFFIAMAFVREGRSPDREPSPIVLDQLGYRPQDRKLAFIADEPGTSFDVRDAVTGATAYTGKIPGIGSRDESSNDLLFVVDVTPLRTPGRYEIVLPERGVRSDPFDIGDDVYAAAYKGAVESFYYQRCGTGVNNGTRWAHPPCHLEDAVMFGHESVKREVTGGWHDAGDYGKFMATAAVSTSFLLNLYEMEPSKFTDGQLNIPEGKNGIPDILDEIRWELSWMLKMQGAGGEVCHKVSTMKWTGERLPQNDPDTRFLFPASSTATAAFAAVAASGARAWKSWDPEFARVLLHAAVEAWKYLQEHRTIVPEGGFRNPPGVEGGEYGDEQDEDERLWAAAELFRTTSDAAYEHAFDESFRRLNGVMLPVSWQHVQNLGYFAYLAVPAGRSDYRTRSSVVAGYLRYCDALLARIDRPGYRCVLSSSEYYWGSNSLVGGYAFDLVGAYELTHQRRYLDGALDQLHYLLGRNGCRRSFVTGFGPNPVRHPYHQFSMVLNAGAPVPGMLVGGPNQNGRLRGKVLSQYPAKCYEDNEKNYFVNEVAINYTAPLAFLAGYFMRGNTQSGLQPQSARRE